MPTLLFVPISSLQYTVRSTISEIHRNRGIPHAGGFNISWLVKTLAVILILTARPLWSKLYRWPFIRPVPNPNYQSRVHTVFLSETFETMDENQSDALYWQKPSRSDCWTPSQGRDDVKLLLRPVALRDSVPFGSYCRAQQQQALLTYSIMPAIQAVPRYRHSWSYSVVLIPLIS